MDPIHIQDLVYLKIAIVFGIVAPELLIVRKHLGLLKLNLKNYSGVKQQYESKGEQLLFGFLVKFIGLKASDCRSIRFL